MKRILTAAVLIMAFLLSSCGHENAVNPEEGDKLKIVTTVFSEYDWVREILGDEFKNADVTWLTEKGVDPHSYNPTADDMLKIAKCDVFIYVGGESDKWIEEVLPAFKNDMIKLSLLDILSPVLKKEEIKEGMEGGGEDEEDEFDEHVWLSLKNAKMICNEIADCLGQADEKNKELYKKNASLYTEKLDELDEKYESAVNSAPNKTLIVADRFPFRYLADDYGISYYAAFAGCSAETEASFKTVVFLANKTDELGLSSIVKIETSDGKIAGTVRNNTKEKNQKIITLNSIQNVSLREAESGTTYLSIMEENLKMLEKALG